MATPDLALRQAAYRSSTQDSSECLCSYDLDGHIIEVNGAFEQLSGYTREEAVRMHSSQLLGSELSCLSRDQILAQLCAGVPQNLRVRLNRKGGEHVELDVTRQLVLERGRPVAVLDSGHPVELSTPTDSQAEGDGKTNDPARFAGHLK